MYVRRVTINNVRSISKLEWSVEPGKEAGWHAIIGDNGSGKSSFLRSIALALVGKKDAEALRQEWDTWLRRGALFGEIQVEIVSDPNWDMQSDVLKAESYEGSLSNLNMPFREFEAQMKKGLTPEQRHELLTKITDILRKLDQITALGLTSPTSALKLWLIRTPLAVVLETSLPNIDSVMGLGSGWFSAAYGPFRRFLGGVESERITTSRPRLAAHLSVFGEDFALTEVIRWLQDLQLRKLENVASAEPFLIDLVTEFVNQQGFLPHNTYMHEVTSNGVFFRDGNGYYVRIEDLSDGYRSVLSMALELLRQLSNAYPVTRLFNADAPSQVQAPGVVLIDEVDAHLHPTWQRRIGTWLCEHFPKIQFIVTTHSPLICQAASSGSVWRLPRPGTNDVGGRVEGTELERLVYGNVLDAYGTDLFGEDVSRSEESKELLQRLAVLNRKERRGTLTNEEREEQYRLRSILPTAADTVKTAEDLAA